MEEKEELQPGHEAPDFSLRDAQGRRISLKDFRGRWVVLYFYPKDNTSGCTREAMDFTRSLKEFEKYHAVVIGVSPDSPESHKTFQQKHSLQVILLSDENREALSAYGVWRLKKQYGREFYGVERSTFLINPEGKIVRIWRKVKVDGHADEVLRTLQREYVSVEKV
ncbi:MAG: thioredoxin-dependent thiol peroxidase [bacterium JZ-2024 1]